MAGLLYNIRDKLNEIATKPHITANFLTLDFEKSRN